MKVNCIIIEDESPAVEILKHYIIRLDFLVLKGIFPNPVSSMPMINAEEIDLIFLDINLPGMSGLDFVRNAKPTAGIILTTAYAEYAVPSFELEVIDFLLKPFSYERFLKSVNRFLKLKDLLPIASATETKKDEGFIFVKSNRKMTKVLLNEILYIEAQKNYLLIVTPKEELLLYQSISRMEERLPSSMFLRIHRSFIVGVSHVDSFTHAMISIREKQIPIGKSYVKDVISVLESKHK